MNTGVVKRKRFRAHDPRFVCLILESLPLS
jgi:hypothetical protein